MTTIDTVGGARPADARNLAALTGREARRLVRHPVLWLAPVILVAATAVETPSEGRNADYWYGTVFVAVTFFGPLITLFAANLVAGSARRSRAEEMLEVTPASDTRRTWATCLGVALPLAATGAVAAAVMALIDGAYAIPPTDRYPDGVLAQLPFVLAGAGLLGVLAARRLPFTGGVLVTFAVFTLGADVAFHRFDSGVWWMWWTTTEQFADRPPGPGRPWLHAAYLAGLCACAATAAVYRDRTRWTRLALIGGPVLAATLVLGQLQLP